MTDTQTTQPFARYLILFDRYIGEEDHQEWHHGDGKAATAQLAKELQEAIDGTGLPVGHFEIIERLVDGALDHVTTTSPAALVRTMSARLSDNVRYHDSSRYDDDPPELMPVPPIHPSDPWHVLLDAINLLDNTMDDDVSPWDQYPEDPQDPKASRPGYVLVLKEARKLVEKALSETPSQADPDKAPWPFGPDGRIHNYDYPPVRVGDTSTGGNTGIPSSEVRRGLIGKYVVLLGRESQEYDRGEVTAATTSSITVSRLGSNGPTSWQWHTLGAIAWEPSYKGGRP